MKIILKSNDSMIFRGWGTLNISAHFYFEMFVTLSAYLCNTSLVERSTSDVGWIMLHVHDDLSVSMMDPPWVHKKVSTHNVLKIGHGSQHSYPILLEKSSWDQSRLNICLQETGNFKQANINKKKQHLGCWDLDVWLRTRISDPSNATQTSGRGWLTVKSGHGVHIKNLPSWMPIR